MVLLNIYYVILKNKVPDSALGPEVQELSENGLV